MKNKKKIIIGILCALVAIMTVGYAAFASKLTISGTSSIDSTWKVEITNITEKNIVGDAVSKESPSYTATTANFSVGLIQPGDSITYEIEISNQGSLAAKVDSINVTESTNDAIIYSISGIKEGDKLSVNEKDTISLIVEYNPEVTSQPKNTNEDITVTVNYVQDIGISDEPSTVYNSYSIGDIINFAGSNWYVIKNSSSAEDYVSLLKEKVLTNSELGEYAYSSTSNSMAYYYSDTCHYPNTYGYTSFDLSGCSGHNDYEGSKVKEYLERTYINTLGSDKLKEVDGYEVRLITKEELQNNLGYATELTETWYNYNLEITPSWVYKNYGEEENGVNGYWTMTAHSDYSDITWNVRDIGNLYHSQVNAEHGVRPVINLLKSSI